MADIRGRITGDSSSFRAAVRGALVQVEGLKVAARALNSALRFSARQLLAASAAAGDVEEQTSLLKEGFGDLTKETQRWAAEQGKAMNRSRFEIQKMAGTMQAMLRPMVGSRIEAGKMSKRMSTLAVDLGSFFNISDDDALAKLRSGLAGMSRPMRELGVSMNIAELDAFAMASGINKTTKDMTEAEKVTLRYNFILDKTRQAWDDAKDTADSFQNRVKGMNARFLDLQIAIGQGVNPVLKVFVKEITAAFDELLARDDLVGEVGEGFKQLAIKFTSFVISIVKVGTFARNVADGVKTAFTIVGKSISVIAQGIKVAFTVLNADVLKNTFNMVELVRRALAAIKINIPPVPGFFQMAEDARANADIAKNEFAEMTADIQKDMVAFAARMKGRKSAVDPLIERLEALRTKLVDLKIVIEEPVGGDGTDSIVEGLDKVSEAADTMRQIVGNAGADVIDIMAQTGKAGKEKTKELIKALAARAGAAAAAWIFEIVPPPANIILAPLAGAAAAAIVSSIGSFHEGGTVNRDDLLRLPGMQSNEGLAMLQAGERVIPASGTQGAGEGGGGGGITINISQSYPQTRADLDRQVRDVILPSLMRLKGV